MIPHNIRRCCIAVALIAGWCAAAAAASPEASIRAALEDWTKAFNSRDAGRVCGLFSRDLIANYQGQPERNYDTLCALLSASLADREKSYRYSLKINEILTRGDLAVVRLVWTLRVARQGGGPAETIAETIEEPGIDVFRRHPDGSWKISRYLAYPAPPHP